MSRSLLGLLAFLAFLPAASHAGAKAIPPSPPDYLYNEGVVSPSAAERISEALRAANQRTGHQIVVALFQSLEGESLEDYANKVFKQWKPGSKDGNDGLLFCVFAQDRSARVEVGYGLEGTLTDLEAGEIARAAGSDYFKAGEYDNGVLKAVEALSLKLEAYTGDGNERSRRMRSRGGDSNGIELALYLLLGFYLFFWATYEMGFHWGMDTWSFGRRADQGPRYPMRALFIFWVYLMFLLRFGIQFLGSVGSGRGRSGGGFSGGGGSSGGGGASARW